MAALPELQLADGRRMPPAALTLRFARAGGPGGQHVNKTETKVDLRFEIEACAGVLRDSEQARLRQALAARADADGRIVVVCAETRSRQRNIELAVQRLAKLIDAALRRQKRRVPTKPSRGSKERRLKAKKQRSDIKRMRRGDD